MNPYPWIFGTVIERNFKVCDVTVERNWYSMCRVSVEPSYDAYLKWHMPIWEEICHVKQKYMPILGTVTRVWTMPKMKFNKMKWEPFNDSYTIKVGRKIKKSKPKLNFRRVETYENHDFHDLFEKKTFDISL